MISPMFRAFLTAFLWIGLIPSGFSQVVFTRIAATGDEAVNEDGDPAGESYDWFNDIVLNASGNYAFRAGLEWSPGVGKDNDSGIWADLDGSLKKVAQEGDDAEGTEDPLLPALYAKYKDIIGSGGHLVLGDSSVLAFRSRLFVGNGSAATEYTDFGLWVAESTGFAPEITLVVREGDDAPDEAGASTGSTFELKGLFPLMCDADGSLAFLSNLYVNRAGSNAEAKNRQGIWHWDSALADLVQVGRSSAYDDPVIETAPDTNDKHFGSFMQPVFGASGYVGFSAKLRNEPRYDDLGDPIPDRVHSKNASGIWSGSPGLLTLAARAEDSSGGGTFFRFFTPGINAGIDLVFRAQLAGGTGGSPRSADTGIWKIDNGLGGPTLTQIALEGNAAPGGGTFAQFRFDPLISSVATEKVAFLADLNRVGTVDRDNNEGIWTHDTVAGLALVAREGEIAYLDSSVPTPIAPPPGSADVRFGRLFQPAINQNGQVAFLAVLKSAPVGLTSAENKAIFAQQTDGRLIQVIRLGGTLDGKTVKGLSFVSGSGGSDGRARGWVYTGATGQLAFTVRFTDGTSAAYVATIP